MHVAGLDYCEYLDCSVSVFENKAKFYESSGKYRGSVLHFRDGKGKTADVYDIWTNFSSESSGSSVLDPESVLQVQMNEALWAMSTIEERLKSLSYVQAIYWEIDEHSLFCIRKDHDWFERDCLPKISPCLELLSAANMDTGSPSSTDRVYLHVPYGKRGTAMRMGALWDSDRCQCYINRTEQINVSQFEAWLHPPSF